MVDKPNAAEAVPAAASSAVLPTGPSVDTHGNEPSSEAAACDAGECDEQTEDEQPADGVEPEVDDTRSRLSRLFTHLKIAKIVFVDDKAELQVDAGAIIRVLAANAAAQEPLSSFFPGVVLDLDNDALADQAAARLTELDAAGVTALRGVLAAQSDDAKERESLGQLQHLLPEGTTAHLLTPQAWHERREALIGECSEDQRTLFLFDQELEVDDTTLGFAKGSDIIREMAEKERAGFGTRWFCGMLTHTVEMGEEVPEWRRLAKSERLDLRFFMPIAKATLDDAPAFYGAVYRTLINTYCQTMKSLAQDAFEEALKEALEQFANVDPIDFEHVIVKSSEREGVSELETLIRVYGIFQKDQVKSQILEKARVSEFIAAARTVKGIADIGRALTPSSEERLYKLRWEELYESDQLVNSYQDPLRNGDIFEIGEGEGLKLWVLIAQPCDLMVRSDGKRGREQNFKVAVLAPLATRPLGDKSETREEVGFSLDHYDHGGAQSAVVKFGDATPANLQVLDLAVFNKDGHCQLSASADPALSLPSRAWELRDAELRKHFGKVTAQVEAARKTHNDVVANLLADAIIPRGAPKKSFSKFGLYEAGAFSYPIRRCARIRDPLAASLLASYSRFLARDAYEHDFSKAG